MKLNEPPQLPCKHITHVRLCKYGGYILISVSSVTISCIWCMYDYNSNQAILNTQSGTDVTISITPILLQYLLGIIKILTMDY